MEGWGNAGLDHDLRLYHGSANPALAAEVARRLGIAVAPQMLGRFPDGEIKYRIDESIRGKDVYIIQSTCPPVNEHLVELLVMVDAARRASAGRITALIPYYGYSRQEKKSTGREPITAKLVADLLVTAGVHRVVSIDLHTPAIQGFFDCYMDHLTALPILADYLLAERRANNVVVAPDAGRVKLADRFAQILNVPLVVVHKRRGEEGQPEVRTVVGEVAGKVPIIIDDMIATGGTIAECVGALLEAGAVPAIRVAATHPLMVGPAVDRLSHEAIAEVVVTDTVPLPPERMLPRMRVLSVAGLLADTIRRLHRNESISALFTATLSQYAV
ncbi:MAG TPA: ribose-phosphate pyrophosphokinase [Chloroflexota bacterium]